MMSIPSINRLGASVTLERCGSRTYKSRFGVEDGYLPHTDVKKKKGVCSEVCLFACVLLWSVGTTARNGYTTALAQGDRTEQRAAKRKPSQGPSRVLGTCKIEGLGAWLLRSRLPSASDP
jgi:hypothetical protein